MIIRDFLAAHWQYLAIYLLFISIVALVLMGYDKHQAKHDGWRVRERTLFLSALLGGSPGAILGMRLFRHKTKHWYFKIGMPLILLVQLVFCIWFFGFWGRS